MGKLKGERQLHKVFSSIRDDESVKKELLASLKGKDLEDRIVRLLDKSGFTEMKMDQLAPEGVDSYIKAESSNDYGGACRNFALKKLRYKSYFVQEPNGSQQSPDFVVFDHDLIQCVDVKFNKGSSRNPVWNGCLPRTNTIYLWISLAANDMTFMRGNALLGDRERRLLLGFWEEASNLAERFNRKKMKNQIYGFQVYSRKTFSQTEKYNYRATTDYLNNEERKRLEDDVIRHLREYEDPRDEWDLRRFKKSVNPKRTLL